MGSKEIHFGVRSEVGLRSESWKCWTAASDSKSDVYLMCRGVGDIKLSLHETGRWHVGWVGKPDDLFEQGQVPDSRHFIVSRRPVANLSTAVLACRIFVPFGAVTLPSEEPEKNVHWVQPPLPNHVIEFQIVLADFPHYCISWPGKALGTKLVGHLPLPNERTVYIVCRERGPIAMPPFKNIGPNTMKGMSQDDLLKANRAVFIGTNDDGSISFCETPVTITKS